MTPRQQVSLSRVVRVVSSILGIAVIILLMPDRSGSLTFREAIPLLSGLAIIFLPDAALRMALPARCPGCGQKVDLEVKHVGRRLTPTSNVKRRVPAFTWTCRSCGECTQIEKTWFDRLITPRLTSSPSAGSNESNYVGD